MTRQYSAYMDLLKMQSYCGVTNGPETTLNETGMERK
jgi:hypothetical protein